MQQRELQEIYPAKKLSFPLGPCLVFQFDISPRLFTSAIQTLGLISWQRKEHEKALVMEMNGEYKIKFP